MKKWIASLRSQWRSFESSHKSTKERHCERSEATVAKRSSTKLIQKTYH